jgi:hypothetical protein
MMSVFPTGKYELERSIPQNAVESTSGMRHGGGG